MKPKLLITFLLIITLPIVIIGWFGFRIAKNEKGIVKQQIEALLINKLMDYDERILGVLEKRERYFYNVTSSLQLSPRYLRDIRRNDSLIKQIFVADARGRLLYPSYSISPNKTELDFLKKTDKIWKDKRFLADVTSSSKQGHSLENAKQTKTHWFVWYWENGINLIYWRHLNDGHIVGIEMDKMMFMADVIAMLPSSTKQVKSTFSNGTSRIVLSNSKNNTVYQWGNYEPKVNELPKAKRQLSYPLNAWSFNYYSSSKKIDGAFLKSSLFSIVIPSFAIVIIFFIALFYFYRESRRDVKDAAVKVNFVNRVSHELKTPLTNIRMYGELLQTRLGDIDERSEQYLHIINDETQRLSRLITNVLTFSKNQKNKLKLHPRPVNSSELIEHIIQQFELSFSKKGIAIETQFDVMTSVNIDPDVVEQILVNLFSNVEKYAASGGFMNVTTMLDGEQLTISVSDKGPGIPQKMREKIFTQFYRLENNLTTGVSGTGIGLTIAKELAILHGGDITIVDSPVGSCFNVTILCEKKGVV